MACPFRCVFCNQTAISGQQKAPHVHEIIQTIERNLHSFPAGKKHIEIAFFGGNFTGLPIVFQEECLALASRYLKAGKIQGIRLSTRPDYIDEQKIQLLQSYGVTTIELGAQSFDDTVLKLSGRGHEAIDIINASRMIKNAGIKLGLQMMIGLPGDTFGKSMHTARQIIEAGADETRIYPSLVIRGTQLEQMYQDGIYTPLSLEMAIDWCSKLVQIFEAAQVKIIRLGLHPSRELIDSGLIAGPFHRSFKELVMTEIWRDAFLQFNFWPKAKSILIEVPSGQLNFAIGFGAKNKHLLLQQFDTIKFNVNKALKGRAFRCKELPLC